MDSETSRSVSNARICPAKQVVKFVLTYFSVLVVLALIFTALNAQPMSTAQEAWRWGFVVTCIISGSLSTASLLMLLYTDLCQNTVTPDVEKGYAEVGQLPANSDNSQSASFKTVMTISSMHNTADLSKKQVNLTKSQLDEMRLGGYERGPANENFVNLTPALKSPVTVVDMPAKRKRLSKGASPVTTNKSPKPKSPINIERIGTATHNKEVAPEASKKDSKKENKEKENKEKENKKDQKKKNNHKRKKHKRKKAPETPETILST